MVCNRIPYNSPSYFVAYFPSFPTRSLTSMQMFNDPTPTLKNSSKTLSSFGILGSQAASCTEPSSTAISLPLLHITMSNLQSYKHRSGFWVASLSLLMTEQWAFLPYRNLWQGSPWAYLSSIPPSIDLPKLLDVLANILHPMEPMPSLLARLISWPRSCLKERYRIWTSLKGRFDMQTIWGERPAMSRPMLFSYGRKTNSLTRKSIYKHFRKHFPL